MNFKAYTFPDSARGRWLVMGVGDLDIFLGGAYKAPFKAPETYLKQWEKEGPSWLILRNQTAERKATPRDPK